MQRTAHYLLGVVVALVLLTPTQARADGFFTPWVGTNFGQSAGDGRGSYGVSAGFMGNGVFGAEFDFGYSPRFFGNEDAFGSNNVMNAMGNLIVGIPIGGTSGGGARPFFTAGMGLIRTDIDGIFDDDSIASNDLGVSLGGGVMGYFNDHVGLRGDVRWFRNVQDNGPVNPFNLDLGSMQYWRASIGIVLR